MMTTDSPAVRALTFAAALACLCRGQSWDAAADFSVAGNPSGAWSYGWSSTVGGTFVPMNAVCFGTQWCTTTAGTHWPYVSGGSGGPSLGVHPKHVGSTIWNTVLRWTAPTQRTVALTGSWGYQSGAGLVSIDVLVLHNGVVVPGTATYITYGLVYPFAATLAVAPGDTLDFVVGPGGNGDAQDGGTVSATVAVQCALGLSAPFGPGSILIANSGCTPNGVYVTAATAVQGAFPNGWFYGVDIPFFELFGLLGAGPPFVGAFDPAGGSNFAVPGGLPSGYPLYAVTVDVDLTSGLARAASPPVAFVVP